MALIPTAKSSSSLTISSLLFSMLFACGDTAAPADVGGNLEGDAAKLDARSVDARSVDAGEEDAGEEDASSVDAGGEDASRADGNVDGGPSDSGTDVGGGDMDVASDVTVDASSDAAPPRTECTTDGSARIAFSERVRVGSGTSGVVGTGDLDGDGDGDVILSEGTTFRWYEGPEFVNSHVLGSGDSVGDGTSFGGKAADVNGDGWVDWVASNGARSEGPGRLWLFLHPGSSAAATGTWRRIEVLDLDIWHQNDLELGDLDGDGRIDIAVRTRSPERRVVMAFQNVDIANWSVRTWPTGERVGAPEGLAIGDVDGDGETEILLSGVVWDAPGGFRMNEPIEHLLDANFVDLAVKSRVADFDGDGDVDDIVMTVAEGSDSRDIVVYRRIGPLSGGPLSWDRAVLSVGDRQVHGLAAADVNCDGRMDVVTGRSFGSRGISIYYGTADWNVWQAESVSDEERMYVLSASDLDGDGDLDIVGPARFHGATYAYFNEAM